MTFPDHNLEVVIREAIGKPRGLIYPADLDRLISLFAPGRHIADLNRLEYCTNLTTLGLASDHVRDISALANLTNLTELDLEWNQISDISPLTNVTNLESLALGSNQISDISPLVNLTHLTVLRLHDNQINDISPLAVNEGLSEGDYVSLWRNPMSSDSINIYISTSGEGSECLDLKRKQSS